MKINFTEQGWEDYIYWQNQDKKIMRKINELLKSITRTPFDGLGKPEPLKNNLSGYWSRRINQEHRIVYKVTEEYIEIHSCRFHY